MSPQNTPIEELSLEEIDGSSTSLSTECSEGEFKQALQQRLGLLDGASEALRRIAMRGDAGKRAFSDLADATARFGAFLDDSRAKTNLVFAPLSEFTSSLRGFARVGRSLCHLELRLGNQLPLPSGEEGSAFVRDTGETIGFVRDAVARLYGALREEVGSLLGDGLRNGADAPANGVSLPASTPVLPDNLAGVLLPDQDRRIAELASKFLGHREILKRQSEKQRFVDPERMRRFVLEVSDEQEVRFFETRIHTLLSRYDTYVEGTPIEDRDPELQRFRSHIVVMLHLLQTMVELVHFYERHENDIRSEEAKNRIAQVIDKNRVLDRILNYNLYYLHAYADLAAPVAECLVDRYTKQTRVVLTVPEGVFIHARPVSLITRVVSHHGTPVTITVGEVSAYAGSIINVLMAVGSNPSVREIVFEGDDAPLADLRLLFEHRLGEGPGPLPEELSYLGMKP